MCIGLGNKGAAVIRFKLYDSTLCFLSAHLRAHQNEVSLLITYTSIQFTKYYVLIV